MVEEWGMQIHFSSFFFFSDKMEKTCGLLLLRVYTTTLRDLRKSKKQKILNMI